MSEDVKAVVDVEQDAIQEEDIVEVEAVLIEEEEEESLPETVQVGDKIYPLTKTGKAQAKQVADLLNWLGSYGQKLASVLVTDEGDATENIMNSTWGMLTAIGQVASEDALVDLFVVVTGCSKSEADKFFSVNTLVDGIQVLLSQEEYAQVINRFF